MTFDCTVELEQGDGVTVVFTAENVGSAPVDLTFSDGQTVEVVVGDEADPTWQYGAGRMFTQALRTETLDPGEEIVERLQWPDATPGEHELTAWLCANDVDCEVTATVTVDG